jgi:hypothetical protein
MHGRHALCSALLAAKQFRFLSGRSRAMAQMHTTVVGVFQWHANAQQAVAELRAAGFTDRQIGFAARHGQSDARGNFVAGDYAAEGTAAGVATGAGLGALWGIGIVTGVMMPVLGPALAGGALAAILSSAAAGAAVAGLAGALVGLGIPKDEAEYYQREFESGRVVVTVAAEGRELEARRIIEQNGGYDQARRDTGMRRTTIDVPVHSDQMTPEREGTAFPPSPPVM